MEREILEDVKVRPRVHRPEKRGAGRERLGARRGAVQKGPVQVDDHQLAEGGRAAERRTSPRTALAAARTGKAPRGARAGAGRARRRQALIQRRAHVSAGVERRAWPSRRGTVLLLFLSANEKPCVVERVRVVRSRFGH
jgi:hypothetical protein